jgi:hypothetical protein
MYARRLSWLNMGNPSASRSRRPPGPLGECGLIEIGRKHARDFDAGHFASGGAAQRVLTELRKQAAKAATPVRSALDDLRARCADRITCSAVVVGMCDSVV